MTDELANNPMYPGPKAIHIFTHPRHSDMHVVMSRDRENRPVVLDMGNDLIDISVRMAKAGYGMAERHADFTPDTSATMDELEMYAAAMDHLHHYSASQALDKLQKEVLQASLVEQLDPNMLVELSKDLNLKREDTYVRAQINDQIKDLQESIKVQQQRVNQHEEFLRRDDISDTTRHIANQTYILDRDILALQKQRVEDLTLVKGIDPANPHHASLTAGDKPEGPSGPEADGPELGAVPTGPKPDQGPTGSEAELDLDADDLSPTGPSAEAYLDDYLQETNDVAPTPAPDWTPEPPQAAPDMYSGEVITDSYELTRQMEARWAADREAIATHQPQPGTATEISMRTFPDAHAAAMDKSRGQIQKSTRSDKKAAKSKVLKRGGRGRR